MVKQGLKILLAILMVLAGLNHFRNLEFYLNMMPPSLPWPKFWVDITGVLEIVLGLMLLVPALTPIAAWGLIGLFILVFPANVQMALAPEVFPQIPAWALWARLPLQGVLIAWAAWYLKP